MRKSAFTLIELLVVIAIIAILAAILFPVFARARAKAQQTQCLSNLKQIAMAEKMYAADYADRYLGQANSTHCDPRYFYLNPYLGIQNITGRAPTAAEIAARWQIWKCPATAPPWNGYHVNYGLNDYGDGQNYTWFMQAEGEIPDSPNVIMWGDGGWNLGFAATGVPNTCNTRVLQGVGAPTTAALNAGLTNDPPFWPFRNVSMQWSFIGRHNGKVNFNFCDGHAKAMDLTEVSTRTIVAGGTYYYYFTWIRPSSY